MKFRKQQAKKNPEINLIPFIDVLLVIIIFLLLTSSYHQISRFEVQLPHAATLAVSDEQQALHLFITDDGTYAINDIVLQAPDITTLTQQLSLLARQNSDTLVLIMADANTTHQSVVLAMDAARRAGLSRLSFAIQKYE